MSEIKKAPTPAELIPTLKEHEWVRGTYKTGTAFGPCTTYYNKIGAMFAGDNNLIHWNSGAISDELATLERCDAPAPKPKGKVTKAHLFDGTIIEVENIAPEGGVTLYPQPKFKVGDVVSLVNYPTSFTVTSCAYDDFESEWEYQLLNRRGAVWLYESDHWSESALTLYVAPLTTLERCDPPEVK